MKRPTDSMALAGFRVAPEGQIGGFMALEMTRDERASRRCFIRGMLKGTKWQYLKNDQLDQVRLLRCGNSWMIEDADLYQYILHG